MKLEEIQNLWELDCNIDRTELGNESIRIPQLHSKYFKIFSQERLLLRKLEAEYKSTYRLKFEWYMGNISDDDLKVNGWDPNPLKILRSDIPMYMDSDEDISKLTLKIYMQKEKVDFTEAIIKSLSNRGFQIKAAIDWEKFKMGV
jgi:hypothetical protein